jgi:hypothetical protein
MEINNDLINSFIDHIANRVVEKLTERLPPTQPAQAPSVIRLSYRESDVAAMFGVKPSTLCKWRYLGHIQANKGRPTTYTQQQIDAVAVFIAGGRKG